jgi:hypothetical protein
LQNSTTAIPTFCFSTVASKNTLRGNKKNALRRFRYKYAPYIHEELAILAVSGAHMHHVHVDLAILAHSGAHMHHIHQNLVILAFSGAHLLHILREFAIWRYSCT